MSAKRKVTAMVPALTPAQQAATRQAIARSRPEDYDGHTEFARLSPAERLDWLGAAATFIGESKRNLKGARAAYAK